MSILEIITIIIKYQLQDLLTTYQLGILCAGVKISVAACIMDETQLTSKSKQDFDFYPGNIGLLTLHSKKSIFSNTLSPLSFCGSIVI